MFFLRAESEMESTNRRALSSSIVVPGSENNPAKAQTVLR